MNEDLAITMYTEAQDAAHEMLRDADTSDALCLARAIAEAVMAAFRTCAAAEDSDFSAATYDYPLGHPGCTRLEP